MLISCSICKDLFFPNSEVCGTKCGHIYHELCLKKWQERSGSCPQCRTKIRERPHRIYFDIEDSPESEAELDATALRQKIDSIRVDLASIRKKNAELEEANIRVHEEIADFAERAESAESNIKTLKEKIKELIAKNKELEPLHQANEALKLKLKSFTNIEILLKGTENDVRELISKTPVTTLAVHQLCMVVEVLKSQLKATDEKYKKENESLLLNYNDAVQKIRDLKRKLIDKKVQTSAEKHCKVFNSVSLSAKDGELKRSYADRFPCGNENRSSCSEIDADCEPPVNKKVINNLEKTAKRDIPSDQEELIFPGPSINKIPKYTASLENKSLFKKSVVPHSLRTTVSASIDVSYDVWGCQRKSLVRPFPSEAKKRFKRLSKNSH